MSIYRSDADATEEPTDPSDWHEANRRGWDAVSPGWQEGIDAQGIWRRCHIEPGLILLPEELARLGDLHDRKVCVLGSGDNQAVFALAGLGGQVTSVDISQSQLDIAAGRAGELGLDIAFLRADVTDLSALPDNAFDVVYTGGHVAVWVSDLKRYYNEAVRILKPGGLFIVNEYHPFRRIWGYNEEHLEMEFGYFDRGPHKYDRSEEVEGAEPGSFPSYEFHWTISDYLAAVLGAGCELVALMESGDARQGWETPDLTGLPEHLLIMGRKRP